MALTQIKAPAGVGGRPANPVEQGSADRTAATLARHLIEIKVKTASSWLCHACRVLRGSEMSSTAPKSADRKHWIAVLVARTRWTTVLSPFFAKSDGLLVVDPCSHARAFRRSPERTSGAICELILASGPDRLVCGFIAGPDRDALCARGMDIRIGSCACSIDALVRDFDRLPSA